MGKEQVHGPEAIALKHTEHLCLHPSVRTVPCYLPATPPRALCAATAKPGNDGRRQGWALSRGHWGRHGSGRSSPPSLVYSCLLFREAPPTFHGEGHCTSTRAANHPSPRMLYQWVTWHCQQV